MAQERTIVIENPNGLHARPASMFVQLANKSTSKVTVIKDGESVDGRSIMGLLSLGLEFKSSIVLKVDGADEARVIEALTEVLTGNH
jgi:phosphotransferase system HPr (HPr) family protein